MTRYVFLIAALLCVCAGTPAPAQALGGQLPSEPSAEAQVLLFAQQSIPRAAIAAAGQTSGPQTSAAPTKRLMDPETPVVTLTRAQAEQLALQNNPRITAAHLQALAAGQVTRETRSNLLPQVTGYLTGEDADNGSRIGAGAGLTSSRLYAHFGAGGTASQLITDFGHTRELVATNKLQQEALDKTTVATQQDVLFATDQAFYRLLDAQSLLDVAQATVNARADVQKLTQALTKSALKSDLDLNIASADLSQSQLLEIDAQNAVASASASLAEILATPPDTLYEAVEDAGQAPPPPPEVSSYKTLDKLAQSDRPDLQSLKLNGRSFQTLARAQELQRLPSISALGTGGITPAAPANIFVPDWYAAGGVNLTLPAFTGFRIRAQTEEARLRQHATEKQVQELSDAVARDVRVALLNAQTAFDRIGVTDKFRNQTAQALALAKTRYKLGLSSIVELSQAQLQSTQADVTSVKARYDYLLSLRSLEYAEGQLAP